MHLRAVIFDYGEVLSKPANQSVYKQLVEISGLPEDLFQKYYWAYRLDYDAAILNGVVLGEDRRGRRRKVYPGANRAAHRTGCAHVDGHQ